MTLKQRIDADGVGMRWIRTAATTITAIAAAAVVLWSAITWTIGPRITEWAESLVMTATLEQRRDIEQVAGHLDRLDGVVEALEQTTSRLAEASLINPAPSWRFDPVETLISDGEIGGERIAFTGSTTRRRSRSTTTCLPVVPEATFPSPIRTHARPCNRP